MVGLHGLLKEYFNLRGSWLVKEPRQSAQESKTFESGIFAGHFGGTLPTSLFRQQGKEV